MHCRYALHMLYPDCSFLQALWPVTAGPQDIHQLTSNQQSLLRIYPMAHFAELTYTGDLHVECVHLQSGAKFVTHSSEKPDAELDGFSPVELCATSLAACATTMIGLFASKHNLDVTGMKVRVNKEMVTGPYRFGKIEIVFDMPDRDYTAKDKVQIERAANSCPVHSSFRADIEQIFTFNWKR